MSISNVVILWVSLDLDLRPMAICYFLDILASNLSSVKLYIDRAQADADLW